ncbi:MAG: TonB-dependent receptor [Bacteroidales bacterium]|nr:TonB-dependent receptor [Bacteroidales bacterium]
MGISSNLVVLVNGISQLSDEYADYPDTKITVPVEAIKRVEIIKGPVSVLYGSGGFFGVINIITHEKEQSQSINVNGSIGNICKGRVNMGVNGSKNELSYSVYASMCNNNGANVFYTDLTSDTSLLNENQISSSAKTSGQLGSQKKYFGSVITVKDLTFDLSYNETVKGIMDGVPGFGDGSEITHSATNFVARHNHILSNKVSSRLQAGYYQHTHNVDYEEHFKYSYRQDYKKTRAFDLEGNVFYSPLPSFHLDVGVYYRNLFDLYQMVSTSYYGLSKGDGEVGIPRGETMQTLAAYCQIDWEISKHIRITGGIRLEHLSDYELFYARGIVTLDTSVNRTDPYSLMNRRVLEQRYHAPNKGFAFIPKGGIIFTPKDYLNIKLLYGKSIKHPNFIDNIRQMIMDNSRFLNPQDIETYEVNLLIKPIGKLFIQGNFFYNNLNNLISASNIYNRETGQWSIQSSNSGKMKTLGIESSVQIKDISGIQIELSGLYQQTSVLSEGYSDEIPGYSPNLLGYAKVAYLFDANLSIGSKVKYTGKMESKWDFEETPEDGKRIGAGSDPYFTVDVNFMYRNIFNKPIYTKINIENLTNKIIRYPTTESNIWIDKGSIGKGIGFILTVGIEL